MRQYLVGGLVVAVLFLMSGCFQKRISPTDVTPNPDEIQDGWISDPVDVDTGGSSDVVDMSDPEVEEIINLLEDLVAEDDEPTADGVVPTTGLQGTWA